jgi:hypothetical protein
MSDQQPNWGKEFAVGIPISVCAIAYFGVVLRSAHPKLLDHLIGMGTILLVGLLIVVVLVVAGMLARRHGRRRVRDRFRGWVIYGRVWRSVMIDHGLTTKDKQTVLIPRRRSIELGEHGHVVTVRMLRGQSLEDWRERAHSLAQAFAAAGCTVSAHRRLSGHLVLTFDRIPPSAESTPVLADGRPHLKVVRDDGTLRPPAALRTLPARAAAL